MNILWYALHVRSRYENSVVNQLQRKGYEAFLPTYTSTRQWSDRVKSLSLPLFPSYIFCRFDYHSRLPLILTPGIHFVVGAVNETEIAALRQVVCSELRTQPWPYLKEGEMVRVCRGPLKGLTGIVVRAKGHDRLIITVPLLMRSISVEVERDWIKPFDGYITDEHIA